MHNTKLNFMARSYVFLILKALCIGALLWALAPSMTHAAGTGPVGWWPFDEGAGASASDLSGNNNIGSLNGAPSWAAGQMGSSSLSLNGSSQWVQVANSSSLNIASMNGMTLSAWVKFSDLSSWPVIFEKSGSYELRVTYLAPDNMGHVDAAIYYPDGTRCRRLTDNQVIDLNAWYLVTAVFSGTSVSSKSCPDIYINGTLVSSSGSPDTALFDDTIDLGIGRRPGSSTQYMSGNIDDARIYGRPLSASEVRELYRGLTGRWSLNEGSGTSITDSAGGYDGTIQGSGGLPQWVSGVDGTALSFNATNHTAAYFGNNPALSPGAGNLSVSLWIKTSTDFTSNQAFVYDDYGGDTNNHVFLIFTTANQIQGGFRDGSGNSVTMTSPTTLNDGNWHHLVLVRNGTQGLLYVDAKTPVTATNASLGTITTSDSWDPTLAGKSNASTDFYTGSINDVRIYSRAITAGDVAELNANTLLVESGLVGYWKFDDGSGTTAADSSTAVYSAHAAHPGTLNTPGWTTGQVSGALSFNGTSDYVSVASQALIDNLGPLTYSAWIDTSSSAGYILMKHSAAFFFFDGQLRFDATYSGHDVVRYSTSNSVPQNQWVHVAMTWDGSTSASNVHLYVNGVETSYDTTTDGSGTYSADDGYALLIGSAIYPSQPAHYLHGSMDELGIWSRALSPAEIQSLYALGASHSSIPLSVINNAPTISLGSTAATTMPTPVQLAALVTDDGQPNGASVTSSWSKVSGPGTVSFTDSTSPVTRASFSVAGTYVLRLTSSDTDKSASSDVTVTAYPQLFALKTLISGTGSGTVTATAINCTTGYGGGTDDCTQSYSGIGSVTLTEAPAAGSTFIGWVGGGCSGTSSTCSASIISATTTVTAFFDSTGTASSHTYYVDTNNGSASDSNPGSLASPWKTIGKAASVAAAGDKVIVKAGTYHEFVTIGSSGTSANPIVFEGERDASGNWLTTIDPSTDASTGWVAAPEIGAGVYKKTSLPFETREMTIDGKRVAYGWDIGNMSTSIGAAYSNSGLSTGAQLLAIPSTTTLTTTFNSNSLINFWDDVKALYVANAGTTYLRLRDGSSPNGMNIRIAPNLDGSETTDMHYPAVKILDKSYVTLRNFKIQGAFGQVHVGGNSSSNDTVESNYLTNGFERVLVEGGAHDNIIRNNDISTNYYGYDDAGAWGSGTTYNSTLREHLYLIAKFLQGGATEDDIGINFWQSGNNNAAYGNHVFNDIGQGIQLFGNVASPFQGTDIYMNEVNNISAHGFMVRAGHTQTKIHDNFIHDSNINMRLHGMDDAGETDRVVYVYRNKLWEPQNIGNQIYTFFLNSSGAAYHPEFWFYHNSFSGGLYGFQPSNYAAGNGGHPGFRFLNNIFSGVQYLGSEVTADFMTTASMVGVFDYNLVTPPWQTYPLSSDPAWYGAHNIKAGAALWSLATTTDFAITQSSQAHDAGLNLAQSFTENGTTYNALPGLTANYYHDSAPDIGAYEYQGSASPATAPGSPTSVTAATSTSASATIIFTAPASDGGSTILYYLASSTPGNKMGVSSGSPIVVPGLTNGTSYTFQVYAVNAVGTSTPSSASNAVTPTAAVVITAPTVTISAASSVTASAAILNGSITVTGNDNATVRGFAYGTNTQYSTATTTENGSFGTGAFTSTIGSGLACNTIYHVRAYATNSGGTGYSSDGTFTTSACPTIPGSATSVTAATSGPNSATITFSAPASDGGSTILYYLASSTPGNKMGVSNSSPIVLSGLTNGTSYTFQVYAVNAVGTSSPSSASNAVTPTAAPGVTVPVMTILDASSMTASGATLNGSISSTGGSNAAIRGFAYGIDTQYSAATTIENGSFSTGAFTSVIANGLACNTVYHMRAYATNSAGTGYSGDRTFTTSSCPVSNPPSTSSAGSSSGGGGGGGGGTAAPAANPATTTPPVPGCPKGYVCTPRLNQKTSVPAASSVFTRDLSVGSEGSDVKALQQFLNSNGYGVAIYGPGSPGNESTTFGNLTRDALARFQNDYASEVLIPAGLARGNGYFGATTRAKISALLTRTSVPAATTNVFTRNLTVGSIGADVKALQLFMNSHGFLIAESGVGSPGNESTYFGNRTRDALAKFQKANDISPAAGFFGPLTMKKINAYISQ